MKFQNSKFASLLKLIKTLWKREKIDAEIQIQRTLDHPNIVRLLHNFEDSIKICLVVELCEKKSLTTLMKNKGAVSHFDLWKKSPFIKKISIDQNEKKKI